MPNVDLNRRALLVRLNSTCLTALNAAVGTCRDRHHYEVTAQHLLLALLDLGKVDVACVLEGFGVPMERARAALLESLDRFSSGNRGTPVYARELLELLQDAWLLASVNHGLDKVRSGVLLQAWLSHPRALTAAELRVFSAIPTQELGERLGELVSGSVEGTPTLVSANAAEGSPVPGEASALAKFTHNFTEQARKGNIDPVLGRDAELRQMIDILSRRRKNNPILVGEPGTGKTAVVEGLALRVVLGDVPEVLRGVEVVGLDLGALQAGASMRGEFEQRLKAVLQEVQSAPKPIILFIDEAHTLIGAGGQGAGDAANLLKPALARGEVRTIAATTWREYKKYFEKDPALARRFEVVSVGEPSPAAAVVMLRGLARRYEETHKVHIRDDAVIAAVEMSHRYLTGRRLPDKAVGLLDTCAARVRIGQSTTPLRLEVLERRIEALQEERAANQRDVGAQMPGVSDRSAALDQEIVSLGEQASTLRTRWEQEKALVDRLVQARAAPGSDLGGVLAELEALQGEEALVHAEVSPATVAQVIAEWTGVPVGKVLKDEAAAILRFEEELNRRIKGQDHALRTLGARIRQAKAGLQDPTQPLGVFLFVGPSGVGKTETALGLADLLYGGERSVITVNMSEFQEKHTVSRLIGSPPGYVGFGEGGLLTEAVRKRPYSVVLLDECEKADPEVMNLFYQVFDKGTLSDGEGTEVDFRNTVVILTSNLATAELTSLLDQGEPPPVDEVVDWIRPVLSRHFKPALLARMTIVPYWPLPATTLRDITGLKVRKVVDRVRSHHGVSIEVHDTVLDAITARCTAVETGARNIDHVIRGSLLPVLADWVLGAIGGEPLPPKVVLAAHEGRFVLGVPDVPEATAPADTETPAAPPPADPATTPAPT